MSDLIQANYRLLRVLPRFGIHLGFGDKSVAEVCRAQGVSMELFLLVCNISTFDDFLPDTAMFKGIDVEDIVLFLQNSHKYYLEQRIPEYQGEPFVARRGARDFVGPYSRPFFQRLPQ